VTVSDETLGSLLPGPVTLIFTRTQHLPADLNPDTNLIGIRIPDHDFSRALCRQLGEPIAQTSANLSGVGQSPLSVEVRFRCFFQSIEFLLNKWCTSLLQHYSFSTIFVVLFNFAVIASFRHKPVEYAFHSNI
jgi:tRNA A37 threonylcarbamoyladenosine synthetase subunit TsaC/SUA5/YrdC